MYVAIMSRLHNYKYRDSLIKEPFKDEYQFDLGYH